MVSSLWAEGSMFIFKYKSSVRGGHSDYGGGLCSRWLWISMIKLNGQTTTKSGWVEGAYCAGLTDCRPKSESTLLCELVFRQEKHSVRVRERFQFDINGLFCWSLEKSHIESIYIQCYILLKYENLPGGEFFFIRHLSFIRIRIHRVDWYVPCRKSSRQFGEQISTWWMLVFLVLVNERSV